MKTKISLTKERVIDYLRSNPEKPFTAMQLAQMLTKHFPEECRKKFDLSKNTRLTTEEGFWRQLAAEIPTRMRTSPNIKTIEERPLRFYYSERSDEEQLALMEKNNQPSPDITSAMEISISESELYPLLAHYLAEEFNLYTMRIDEKKSSNRRGTGGNVWLYPDMVSLENLTHDWNRDLRDCIGEMTAPRAQLWSFEVKKLLNRSNVREAYFQAVSNSSWANYGYLVVGRIEGGDTVKELRMLYGLHGIGVIQLNIKDIAESEVVIPARFRNDIDWSTANRLCEENSDFRQFVKLVRQFHQTDEVPETGWDGHPPLID
jgi:hypothetical protein